MMEKNVSFTNLDFSDIRDKLKEYLKGQDQFKDYDYDGSNMSLLIELLAYNTFYNNYYTNQAVSEMFLDSAQFRSSVVSHSKELGYLPRSRRSARIVVDFEVFPNDNPTTITLPESTLWTARNPNDPGDAYSFSLRESKILTPSAGRYLIQNVTLYEGEWVQEYYTVTGEDDEKFVINNDGVDTTSLRVFIKENSSSTTETEYLYRDNIYDVDSTDSVFYLQGIYDTQYEVYFGGDTFGTQPSTGNVIRVLYQISSGDDANGIREIYFENEKGYPTEMPLFIPTEEITGYRTKTTRKTVSEGGAERESISAIKFNAPNSIQIQNRAITERDYRNIILSNFPEVTSVSVYGGEKKSPPEFGRVYIAVDTREYEGVSDTTKEKIVSYLSDKTALSIDPFVENAKFMYIEVISNVTFNRNRTNKSSSDIEDLVRDTILSYSSDNLEKFSRNFRFSRLSSDMDSTDTSIISNDTVVRSIIDMDDERLSVNYYASLKPDVTYSESTLSTYEPCITTDFFTYQDTLVKIQDNGTGRLDLVYNDDEGVTKILANGKNIGSVDYTNGIVSIQITITFVTGEQPRMYARMATKDIVAPFDRILSIRDKEISVAVTGIRE